jgi:hypothetical protein
VPEAQIQTQTGHKSLPVLRGYIRRGSLFRDNAAGNSGCRPDIAGLLGLVQSMPWWKNTYGSPRQTARLGFA